MLLHGNVLYWVAHVHYRRSELLRLVMENLMHLHIGFHDGCRVERGVTQPRQGLLDGWISDLWRHYLLLLLNG